MPRWLSEPPPSLQRCPWVPRPHPRTCWNLQNLSGSLSPHTVKTAPGSPEGPHALHALTCRVLFLCWWGGGVPPTHLEGAVAAAAGHICSFRHGWSCIARRPVLVGGEPRRSRRGRSGDPPPSRPCSWPLHLGASGWAVGPAEQQTGAAPPFQRSSAGLPCAK